MATILKRKLSDIFHEMQGDEWIALVCGIVTFWIGAAVLLGWFIHSPVMVQILPNLSAMQFNTALCIALSSLALLFYALRTCSLSPIFAGLSALLALLTCSQYIFDIQLGIDQLFFTYDLPLPMKYPGRMAFNTSVALSSINISLLFLCTNIKSRYPFIPLGLSALVIGITLVSFYGFIAGLESQYGWSDFTRMALHTSISCFLLSSSIFLIALKTSLSTNVHSLSIPIAIVLAISSTTIAAWQSVRAQSFISLNKVTAEQLNSLKIGIENVLSNNTLSFLRMVARYESMPDYPQSLWEMDAHNYLNDLVGINAIGLLDKDLKTIATVSQAHTTPDFSSSQLSADALSRLKKGRFVNSVVNFKKNILSYYPIIINKEMTKIIVSSTDIEFLIKSRIKRFNLIDYIVSLYYEGQLLFSAGGLYAQPIGNTQIAALTMDSEIFALHMKATKTVFFRGYNFAQTIPLYAGLFLTLLGGLAAWFGQNLFIQRKELKATNAELKLLAKKAEAGTAAKLNFLASISHEIRTPLNAITGTIELMQETELNETQKKYATRILKSSRLLLDLISEILDFSKMEADAILLQRNIVNIHEVVKTVAENLIIRRNGRPIEILASVPSQPIPPVYSDAVRLQQILTNLTNNAMKFTEQGSIVIDCQVLRNVSDILYVSFKIIDTGIGIAQEDLGKIFQTFAQLDEARSRKYGGVGLGLSICQKLASLMGGEIKVASEIGKGSIFSLELPLQIAAQEPLAMYSIQNKSILLIDESTKESAILHRYLTDWGGRVDLQPTDKQYDFVILSTLTPGYKVKTILIANFEDARKAPAGVFKLLPRPILAKDLYNALQE